MHYGRHRLLFTTPFLLSLAGQCYFLLYNKLPTSLIIAGQWNVEELEAWNDGEEETSSYAKGVKSETGRCNRILLYASDLVAQNTGVGHRLSFYLLASVIAVLTDSALVILDPPPSNEKDQWAKLGGSPFGCPIKINGDGEYCGQLYPTGLSRIIKVPEWLSRGCGVPTCIDTHSYENWIEIAERTTSKTNFTWTTCTNDDDDRHGRGKDDNNEFNDVAVLPIGKWHLRDYWFYRMRRKLFNGYRSSSSNGNNRQDIPWEEWVTNFSTRMGASQSEIDNFLSRINITIKDDSPIDYLGALITRAKVLQFQPWIIEDVMTSLEAVDLFSSDSGDAASSSLELFDTAAQSNDAVGYDAMHIRRGDRVGTHVNTIEVERYWVLR